MTWARLGNLALWAIVAGGAIGLPAVHWFEDRKEERARSVFEDAAGRAAMAKVADLPTARLISVRADRIGSACGWIELSPEIGAVPFSAISAEADNDDIFTTVPRLDVADPVDWVLAVFSKQLTTAICDRPYARDEQLPMPPNANRNPLVDGPILALWDEDGPEWAVVPARGVGYVALRRQRGGGATMSPVFPDRVAAELWTRTDGAALARSRDARGAERMRRFDACLGRHEPGDPARRSCFAAWDAAPAS